VNRENARKLEGLLSKSNIKHSVVVSNLNQAEKNLAYNTSDILIFPFTKQVDSYDKSVAISDSIKAIDPPLTLLEAMACGKIVIASRTLSIPNVIKHNENGFLVDPEDFEGFRGTLENVMDNFHELQHVGENARRTIQKHFSSKEVNKKLIDVYKSVARATASNMSPLRAHNDEDPEEA
jgi:glycosyltransferase involved in cell wall biosynthesis